MDQHFEVLPKGRRITFNKGDCAAGTTVFFPREAPDREAAEKRAREEAVALYEHAFDERIDWYSATVVAAHTAASVTVEIIVRNWS